MVQTKVSIYIEENKLTGSLKIKPYRSDKQDRTSLPKFLGSESLEYNKNLRRPHFRGGRKAY